MILKSNNQIKANQVRLIDQNGQMVGVVPLADALIMAQSAGLDLVEVSPNPELPVCKILDFHKLKYDAKKKAALAKKKQKVSLLKEIKLRPNIGQNDLDIKIKHIKEFIEHNHKVKIILTFRGREITHPEIGTNIMQNIIEQLGNSIKVEFGPKIQGNQILLIIMPQ